MQLTRTRTLPLPSQWYFPNPRRENLTHFLVLETLRHLRQ